MQKIKKHEQPVLAIDLGGTKVLGAIISDEGQVMAREYHRTLANEGPQPVINRMLSAIDYLLSVEDMSLSQLNSISVAAAGAIDMNRGLVTF